MDKLFNNKVSIITKAEIRYEGTLYQINPQQQTLALKEVRSFGTEGRRPDHEIPPNSQTYDVLVFKAIDIKELKNADDLLNQEKQNVQSQPQELPKQTPPPQTQYRKQGDNRQFDFEEVCEKMNELEKVKKQEIKPKYNKTSFFDNLSTNKGEKQQIRNQNQLDTDTFGNFYKQKQNYHPQRGNQRHQNSRQVVYVEKQQAEK
ncbi:hypothetical protein pb186bvf_011825 [Paramecium bursaria]